MDKKRDTRHKKTRENELRCSAATSTQAPSKRPNRIPQHVAWNTSRYLAGKYSKYYVGSYR